MRAVAVAGVLLKAVSRARWCALARSQGGGMGSARERATASRAQSPGSTWGVGGGRRYRDSKSLQRGRA